jgi:hypothetical protein
VCPCSIMWVPLQTFWSDHRFSTCMFCMHLLWSIYVYLFTSTYILYVWMYGCICAKAPNPTRHSDDDNDDQTQFFCDLPWRIIVSLPRFMYTMYVNIHTCTQ